MKTRLQPIHSDAEESISVEGVVTQPISTSNGQKGPVTMVHADRNSSPDASSPMKGLENLDHILGSIGRETNRAYSVEIEKVFAVAPGL